jgi:hypothetical protein
MNSENAIKLAAKMYEARDAAKILFGAEYDTRMAAPMSMLKQTAEENNISVLDAAQKIARIQLDRYQGMGAMIVIAAAVELCERPE